MVAAAALADDPAHRAGEELDVEPGEPLASTVKTTDTSGTMAIRNAVVTTMVTSRSVALRGPSTTREVRYTASGVHDGRGDDRTGRC